MLILVAGLDTSHPCNMIRRWRLMTTNRVSTSPLPAAPSSHAAPCLASAMAANKEPASIIAAQLRHADGGALAQRVYIHQLPQTAPRLAGVIEGVFGPAARDGRSVSAARRVERNRRETRPSNPA